MTVKLDYSSLIRNAGVNPTGAIVNTIVGGAKAAANSFMSFLSPTGTTVNSMQEQQSAMMQEYQSMITLQQQFQMNMQKVSLQSNSSKTEHETRMAVVRNTKVQ